MTCRTTSAAGGPPARYTQLWVIRPVQRHMYLFISTTMRSSCAMAAATRGQHVRKVCWMLRCPRQGLTYRNVGIERQRPRNGHRMRTSPFYRGWDEGECQTRSPIRSMPPGRHRSAAASRMLGPAIAVGMGLLACGSASCHARTCAARAATELNELCLGESVCDVRSRMRRTYRCG